MAGINIGAGAAPFLQNTGHVQLSVIVFMSIDDICILDRSSHCCVVLHIEGPRSGIGYVFVNIAMATFTGFIVSRLAVKKDD